MIIASITNAVKSYPSVNVLDNVNLAVKRGDKIGLVGANGTGKTTLLEIIYGLIDIDSGSVDVNKGTKTEYLPQSFSDSPENRSALENSLYDFVESGFSDLLALKDDISGLEQKIADNQAGEAEKKRYSELLDIFQIRGGYSIETSIDKIISGLGFSKNMHEMPLATMSGGEKNRALLARLLVANPDFMLLDEPTNHLDIEGIEFLENYLSNSPASAIIVSHDRRFLDRTVNKIWEIYAAKIKVFPGNYTNYIKAKQKQDKLELKAYTLQQEFIKKTKTFVAKNIAGLKTKQAQSRRKMLHRLKRLDKPSSAQKTIGINFGNIERSDRIISCFKDVSFRYDTKPILTSAEFTIERGDKIGLIGGNGTGKTTILELIVENKELNSGEIISGKKLQTGYFRQDRNEFNPDDKVIDVIARVLPDQTEGKLRDYLGGFLFSGDDVFRKICTFSGGQQSRLGLAILIAKQPNFLVLDEPTNHLDIASREVLEQALNSYAGTLLAVSHDRYFLDNVVDRIFILRDGTVKVYLGNYSYYETKKLESQKAAIKNIQPKKAKKTKPKNKRINPLIVQKAKDEIKAKETELEQIDDKINSGDYSSNWEKLHDLQTQKGELEKELLLMYEKLDELKSGEK